MIVRRAGGLVYVSAKAGGEDAAGRCDGERGEDACDQRSHEISFT